MHDFSHHPVPALPHLLGISLLTHLPTSAPKISMENTAKERCERAEDSQMGMGPREKRWSSKIKTYKILWTPPMGPMGPHENPFSGVAHAQSSELRNKWEKRKLYPPRGTQVHLLVGKTSPHAQDPPNSSGFKALFLWKALPNTSAAP